MTSVLNAAALSLMLLLGACATSAPAVQTAHHGSEWPTLERAIPVDRAMERRIAAIVAGMTLEQKVGQMTQPDIRSITPQEVAQYYIGSVLNGGGAWPNMEKHATVQEWAAFTARYHDAAMASDMATKIPLIWGVDAVHGHNNVRGATIFPHNIGLGAANDPDLIERIGRATAQQVRATGINWVFAPTVAVAENRRWGRTYESWSSNPALVRRYADAMVRGLQGGLDGEGDVIATAKHYLADGGTTNGDDQGVSHVPFDRLVSVHAAGYYAAIEAGVQTVMASYSSWTDGAGPHEDGKMHGNRELMTGALKEKLGFDGILVSDWNGIEQLPGCRKDHCPQAINAGLDIVMVPEDWRAFIVNTVADVREGRIPEFRIDDAVTRILRVKMRSGLFDQAVASSRFTGRTEAIDADALAREAVRKSAVLLKNDGGALPLRAGQKVLVVGESANSLSNQSGGWSLTWQGTGNTNADFAGGQTLLQALRTQLGAENVVYQPDGAGVDVSQFSAVVAVLGEAPYAEYNGDIDFPKPLQHSALYPADLAALRAVSGKGNPVVSVLYSGRPAYVNDLLNLSDAFVAAFLPGTEGAGLADVLVDGRHDFTGRLSFAWPGSACSTGEGPGDVVQFQRGYGLSYRQVQTVGQLPEPPTPVACQ